MTKLTFDFLDAYALEKLSVQMRSIVDATMRDYDTGGSPTHIAYTELGEFVLAWPMGEHGSRLLTLHMLRHTADDEPNEFVVDFTDAELVAGVETTVTL